MEDKKPLFWKCKCGWYGKAGEVKDPYNCPKCNEMVSVMIQTKTRASTLRADRA